MLLPFRDKGSITEGNPLFIGKSWKFWRFFGTLEVEVGQKTTICFRSSIVGIIRCRIAQLSRFEKIMPGQLAMAVTLLGILSGSNSEVLQTATRPIGLPKTRIRIPGALGVHWKHNGAIAPA